MNTTYGDNTGNERGKKAFLLKTILYRKFKIPMASLNMSLIQCLFEEPKSA